MEPNTKERELEFGKAHEALAAHYGWRLHGWTGDLTASFFDNEGHVFQLGRDVLKSLHAAMLREKRLSVRLEAAEIAMEKVLQGMRDGGWTAVLLAANEWAESKESASGT